MGQPRFCFLFQLGWLTVSDPTKAISQCTGSFMKETVPYFSAWTSEKALLSRTWHLFPSTSDRV